MIVPATVFECGGGECYCCGVGKVREWTKRAVSKAVASVGVPRVRIPVLPPFLSRCVRSKAPLGALVERIPGGA